MAETSHTYAFEVAMTCGGCSGAVQRVLDKMEGINVQEVKWETKSVIVVAPNGTPDFDTVREKIAKTQKKVIRGTDNGIEVYKADA